MVVTCVLNALVTERNSPDPRQKLRLHRQSALCDFSCSGCFAKMFSVSIPAIQMASAVLPDYAIMLAEHGLMLSWETSPWMHAQSHMLLQGT